MRDIGQVLGFREWSFAAAALPTYRELRRDSAGRKLRAGLELVGFVLVVALALPIAASLGILLGTALAP